MQRPAASEGELSHPFHRSKRDTELTLGSGGWRRDFTSAGAPNDATALHV